MPKKLIAPGQTHGFIGDKPKSKPKPKEPFIDTLLDYKLRRDRVLWKQFPASRKEIEEHHKNDLI